MLLGVASKLLAVAELSVKRMAANTTLPRSKVSMLGLFLPQCGTHTHCVNAIAALQSLRDWATLLQLPKMSSLHIFTMSLTPSLKMLGVEISFASLYMLYKYDMIHAQQLKSSRTCRSLPTLLQLTKPKWRTLQSS
jgi:hypothetical protein